MGREDWSSFYRINKDKVPKFIDRNFLRYLMKSIIKGKLKCWKKYTNTENRNNLARLKVIKSLDLRLQMKKKELIQILIRNAGGSHISEDKYLVKYPFRTSNLMIYCLTAKKLIPFLSYILRYVDLYMPCSFQS